MKSVDTACKLVAAMETVDQAGVTELAEEVGVDKSTVHGHLNTLRRNNLVVKTGTKYRLSLEFLALSEHVKDQIGPYDIITEEVDELAAETGEVAQFATEEQEQVVYVYKSEGENAVRVLSSPGHRTGFHHTALGKAILAHMRDQRVENILESTELTPRTDRTITDPAVLRDQLEEVRERGYAIDDEETVPGIRCVAVPVVIGDPEVLGAVSVSGPASRMNDERIESELSTLVVGAANVIDLNTSIP